MQDADSIGYGQRPAITTDYNPRVLKLLKSFEGFSSKPYKDVGGVWTQGYGNTIGVSKNSKDVSRGDGEDLLKKRIARINKFINNVVVVPINNNQRVALISLIDNIGEDVFLKSTLLKNLNHGDYYSAMLQFGNWRFVKGKHIVGLLNRRLKEVAIFSGVLY